MDFILYTFYFVNGIIGKRFVEVDYDRGKRCIIFI